MIETRETYSIKKSLKLIPFGDGAILELNGRNGSSTNIKLSQVNVRRLIKQLKALSSTQS